MMKNSGLIVATMLTAALLATGCAKKESAVDKAVDSTKDALNIRDHEKLKDAGEEAKDAVNDAADGVKDAAKGD
jgi:hypothetical protein